MSVILLCSRANPASVNVANHLLRAHKFTPFGHSETSISSIPKPALSKDEYPTEAQVKHEWETKLDGQRVILTVIDADPLYLHELPREHEPETEYCIVLSKHKSESSKAGFTAHVPGNWSDAGMGGAPKTLNFSLAGKMKVFLQACERMSAGRGLDWPVDLECDHHGPTVTKPVMFVEIGASVTEWTNETAGKIVADAVRETVQDKRTCASRAGAAAPGSFTLALGAGGGHYCPKFTKLVLETPDIAIGHVLPEYQVEKAGADVFNQALARDADGPATVVLLDWKGLKSAAREKVQTLAAQAKVEWKKA